MPRDACGWHGSIRQFMSTGIGEWQRRLLLHYSSMPPGGIPSAQQMESWTEEFEIMRSAIGYLGPDMSDLVGVAFEYELPREGGRRPDVVLVTRQKIVVLEFKQKNRPTPADVDQVWSYARDLANYHALCRDRTVCACLVNTRGSGQLGRAGEVALANRDTLGPYLLSTLSGVDQQSSDLNAWLDADYEPLPSLVEAARLLFEQQPLPNIRRAHSARIPEVVDYLHGVVARARAQGGRHLALVTGVPGAGKTLVGLQFVYSRELTRDDGLNTAVFLSGNGPLVEVLQHTLQSKAFVQPMRNYIMQYALRDRLPKEQVLVFDEAQRAWDIARVQEKHHHAASEPDLLLRLANSLPNWSVVVGLIGSGQEIHIGEEAGLSQWNDALRKLPTGSHWTVHVPPALESAFPEASSIVTQPLLALTNSLRTHVALDVQIWIEELLSGHIEQAWSVCQTMRRQGFALYVTRDLDLATSYVMERYEGLKSKRYGLVASSKAKNLNAYGINNDWQATKRLRVGAWFADAAESASSCCNLTSVVTEFQCQGLELDMPIVCWGDDFWRNAAHWVSRPSPRSLAKNPHQLRVNSYRVLLSRGRDGVVIWVPPGSQLDETFTTLLAAGVHVLSPTVAVA